MKTASINIPGLPQIHVGAWTGLVKKPGQDPTPLAKIIELAANATSKTGRKLDGLDWFPFGPHGNFDSDDDILRCADMFQAAGLQIGSVVVPGWSNTGGGSALTKEGRARLLKQVTRTLHVVALLEKHGVKPAGLGGIRIDTADDNHGAFLKDTAGGIKAAAATFDAIYALANAYGTPAFIELEMAWVGINGISSAEAIFNEMAYEALVQGDFSHLLTLAFAGGYGYDAITKEAPSAESALAAYDEILRRIGSRIADIHVAQSKLALNALGMHGVTGAHELPNLEGGYVNYAEFIARTWKAIPAARKPKHINWDGCGWDTADLESPERWNEIADAMEASQAALIPLIQG